MKLIKNLIIVSSTYAIGLLIGCQKDTKHLMNPPVVTTNAVTNISSTSVVSGGAITNGTNITDKGIVWGTDSSSLTVSNVNKFSNGAGQYNFVDTIQNLQSNTNYYLRAYAVYSTGISYGAIIKFTSLPPQPTVYVAGANGISSVYWKNGTMVPLLTSGTIWAWAHSIYVVGNDVYAAGDAQASGSSIFAVYWKNGIAVPLTDTSNIGLPFGKYRTGIAYSIYVVGNDVYVAGYELLNGEWPVAKYWKNGVPVSLSGGTIDNNGNAYSIYVIGSDVYVAGAIGNDYLGSTVATYWKNGIAVSLTDGGKTAGIAQSIFVKDNDVYVAGSETVGLGIGSVTVAKYWINGTGVSLTDGSQNATANSIYVAGRDVYVTGWEYNGTTGFSVAKYWKNGTAVSMPITNANQDYIANSIYVAGNDVYVVGYKLDESSGYTVAKYWKNGAVVPLGISSNDSRCNSIFVQ